MNADWSARFGGITRLYGEAAAARLEAARVAVIGLGGVGSWAAESLARSGIGALDLVDLDDVCASNINRQTQALTGTVGQAKTAALADRVRAIHPGCRVCERRVFYSAATSEAILHAQLDLVIDAIDAPAAKCLLLVACREHGLPIITCGGAGGRKNPTAVRVTDITRCRDDALLAVVRKRLRARHGFPRNPRRNWGIPCVWSEERATRPAGPAGTACAPPAGTLRLTCDEGYGSAVFVTGAFGFALAAEAVAMLLRPPSAG